MTEINYGKQIFWFMAGISLFVFVLGAVTITSKAVSNIGENWGEFVNGISFMKSSNELVDYEMECSLDDFDVDYYSYFASNETYPKYLRSMSYIPRKLDFHGIKGLRCKLSGKMPMGGSSLLNEVLS